MGTRCRICQGQVYVTMSEHFEEHLSSRCEDKILVGVEPSRAAFWVRGESKCVKQFFISSLTPNKDYLMLARRHTQNKFNQFGDRVSSSNISWDVYNSNMELINDPFHFYFCMSNDGAIYCKISNKYV